MTCNYEGTKTKLCRSLDCEYCRERSFESEKWAEIWNYEKNGSIKPRDVFKKTGKKYWFTCPDCKHDFEKVLNNMSKVNQPCSYCTTRLFCDEEKQCKICFEKSFASHPYVEHWDYEMNIRHPCVFAKFSDIKCWFKCPTCPHSYNATPENISSGSRCPYCSSPPKRLCGKDDCNVCLNKSLASIDYVVKNWDNEKNKKKPNQTFNGGDAKCWLICPDCRHSFDISASNLKRGNRCAYCAKQRKCENPSECEICITRMFISVPYSVNWNYEKNGDVRPENVFKSITQKFWFICPECKGDYHATLGSVSAGYRCACTKNKTETKVKQHLAEKYSKEYNVQYQAKYDWCKNESGIRHLPFDFALVSKDNPDLKYIIEIDGPQHFIQILNWKSPELTQIQDKHKECLALENNYKVIRLKQEEIWMEKFDWKTELNNAIISDFQSEVVFVVQNKEKNYYSN